MTVILAGWRVWKFRHCPLRNHSGFSAIPWLVCSRHPCLYVERHRLPGEAHEAQSVGAKVRERARRFRELGAVVESVSIPMHRDDTAIWTPIALRGLPVGLMLVGRHWGEAMIYQAAEAFERGKPFSNWILSLQSFHAVEELQG